MPVKILKAPGTVYTTSPSTYTGSRELLNRKGTWFQGSPILSIILSKEVVTTDAALLLAGGLGRSLPGRWERRVSTLFPNECQKCKRCRTWPPQYKGSYWVWGSLSHHNWEKELCEQTSFSRLKNLQQWSFPKPFARVFKKLCVMLPTKGTTILFRKMGIKHILAQLGAPHLTELC